MRKLILAAGVAAMAISAPAAARPNKGGHGGHAQAQRGGGHQAKAQRGGGQRQAHAQRRGGSQRQAHVQRGGGQRQAHVQRRGNAGHAQAQRGGGHQRVAGVQRQRGHGNAQRSERHGGQRFANFRTQEHGHGKAQRVQRAENRGHGNRNARVADRGRHDIRVQNHGRGNRDMRVAHRGNREFRANDRGNRRLAFENHGRGNQNVRIVNRGFGDRIDHRGRWHGREFRVADRQFAQRVLGDRYFNTRNYDRVHNTVYYVNSGLPAAYYGGCPAGLTWDSWSCVPPYYAQTQFVGRVLPTMYSSNYFPQSLRYIYADTPNYYYRWGDGYVYRVNRSNDLIAALLPLIGAGFGVGMPFPYSGPQYYVPSGYQSFYPSYGGDDYYRYANGYVYEIDGDSGYIEDVIPLLDRGYGVGQMLPVSYSYYNVPYQYRTLYYDTPDYYYRYAPGAIYQVDRDSQLITSVASLLTGGLAVGQPLPASYSVYNVPYQYRATYYDRPDAWYRYSDGYIYQVDPTTQLITAIVRAIV